MALPIEIRDVAPGPGFTRLDPGKTYSGLPDGIHTGGCWLSPDGNEVWKPLDGRPAVNADHHLPTREAECLEAMAGSPAFPRNWRVEEAGEVTVDGIIYTRRWLVRRKAWVVPDDFAAHRMNFDAIHEVERGMRALDRAGWSMGDHLQVAYDRQGRVFILSLSCAYQTDTPTQNEHRFRKWARAMGLDSLVDFRKRAEAVTSDLGIIDQYGEPYWYAHVYASVNRPISSLWADIPNAIFIDGDYDRSGVWTWVVVPEPLDDEIVNKFELAWGWSPVRS